MIWFEKYEKKARNYEMTTFAVKKQTLLIIRLKEAGNKIGHLFHLLSDNCDFTPMVIPWVKPSLWAVFSDGRRWQAGDTFGVLWGFQCSREAAQAIEKSCRATHWACSLCWDQYIVMLPCTEESTPPSQAFLFPSGLSKPSHPHPALRK